MNHPGQTMTIYDIPVLVAQSYPLAATPKNIQSGFRVSGIFPFNQNVFDETEFSPCKVTDRDLHQENQEPDLENPKPGTSGISFQTDEPTVDGMLTSKLVT